MSETHEPAHGSTDPTPVRDARTPGGGARPHGAPPPPATPSDGGDQLTFGAAGPDGGDSSSSPASPPLTLESWLAAIPRETSPDDAAAAAAEPAAASLDPLEWFDVEAPPESADAAGLAAAFASRSGGDAAAAPLDPSEWDAEPPAPTSIPVTVVGTVPPSAQYTVTVPNPDFAWHPKTIAGESAAFEQRTPSGEDAPATENAAADDIAPADEVAPAEVVAPSADWEPVDVSDVPAESPKTIVGAVPPAAEFPADDAAVPRTIVDTVPAWLRATAADAPPEPPRAEPYAASGTEQDPDPILFEPAATELAPEERAPSNLPSSEVQADDALTQDGVPGDLVPDEWVADEPVRTPEAAWEPPVAWEPPAAIPATIVGTVSPDLRGATDDASPTPAADVDLDEAFAIADAPTGSAAPAAAADEEAMPEEDAPPGEQATFDDQALAFDVQQPTFDDQPSPAAAADEAVRAGETPPAPFRDEVPPEPADFLATTPRVPLDEFDPPAGLDADRVTADEDFVPMAAEDSHTPAGIAAAEAMPEAEATSAAEAVPATLALSTSDLEPPTEAWQSAALASPGPEAVGLLAGAAALTLPAADLTTPATADFATPDVLSPTDSPALVEAEPSHEALAGMPQERDAAVPLAAVAAGALVTSAASPDTIPDSTATETFAHAHEDVGQRTGFLSHGILTKLGGVAGLAGCTAGLLIILATCAGLTPTSNEGLLAFNRDVVRWVAVGLAAMLVLQVAVVVLTKGRWRGVVQTAAAAALAGGAWVAIEWHHDQMTDVDLLGLGKYVWWAGLGGLGLGLLGGLIEHRRLREETAVLAAAFTCVLATVGGVALQAVAERWPIFEAAATAATK
jgi:hypothetical protein